MFLFMCLFLWTSETNRVVTFTYGRLITAQVIHSPPKKICAFNLTHERSKYILSGLILLETQ